MMKATALKEKMDKANERVSKTRTLIEKQEKRAEKLKSKLIEQGYDPNNKYCRKNKEDYYDAYWAIVDYHDVLENIEESKKKLIEQERIAENWTEKHLKASKQEYLYVNQLPDVLKDLEKHLGKKWGEWDIKYRNELNEAWERRSSANAFCERYSYTEFDRLRWLSDEEVIKQAEDTARVFILDLVDRIFAVVGEVEDYSDIHFAGNSLNGQLKGKLGSAKVETIMAGGYNIQRLHYRVLVKRIK